MKPYKDMSRDELLAECERLRTMVAAALDVNMSLRAETQRQLDANRARYDKVDRDWHDTVLGR